MKVRCDNFEEFLALRRACEYLHDFHYEDKNGDMNCLDMDNEIIGFIAHLYLDKADFPTLDEYVTFEKEDGVEYYHTRMRSEDDQFCVVGWTNKGFLSVHELNDDGDFVEITGEDALKIKKEAEALV